ncbi:MAG: hypothetical protein JXA99_08645 [Candidatus Lokiarchaeota archaeon]|nr:hypothetical protein [Candidatus Lokiarchaeota archaeon]
MSKNNNKNIGVELKANDYISSEINDNAINTNSKESAKAYFFQIDVLKVVCIILVVISHANYGFPLFKITEIIPPVQLFIIILGFNQGHSFKRRNLHKLSELYSYEYLKKIFWRFIFPLILLNIFCFIFDFMVFNITSYHIFGWSESELGFISWGETNLNPNDYTNINPFFLLLGAPFFPGPGSYFILVIIQFIVIFPLIYKLFDKNPIIGLICCYIIEFTFQIISNYIPYGGLHFLFSGTVLRFLSAIGLGVWFIYNHELFSKHNLFVLLLIPLSIFLLLCSHNADLNLFPASFFNPDIFEPMHYNPNNYGLKFFNNFPWWPNTNLFVYFYYAFIFLVLMKILPSKLNKEKSISRKTQNFFRSFSKVTYHILLVQTVFFMIAIPLSSTYWDNLMIPEDIYDTIVDPITAGITDVHLMSIQRYMSYIIAKIFFFFIITAIVVTIALCFYLVESGLRISIKKTGTIIKGRLKR